MSHYPPLCPPATFGINAKPYTVQIGSETFVQKQFSCFYICNQDVTEGFIWF